MAILPQKDKMDGAIQNALNNLAPSEMTLNAETGNGTDITTNAVSQRSIASMVQYVWGKIRQVANVLNGKQPNIAGAAGATALLVKPTTNGGAPQERALNTLMLSPTASTAQTQVAMIPATQGNAPDKKPLSDFAMQARINTLAPAFKRYINPTISGSSIVITDPNISSSVSEWYEGMTIIIQTNAAISSNLGITLNGIGKWVYTAVSGGSRVSTLAANSPLSIYYSQARGDWVVSPIFGMTRQGNVLTINI